MQEKSESYILISHELPSIDKVQITSTFPVARDDQHFYHRHDCLELYI